MLNMVYFSLTTIIIAIYFICRPIIKVLLIKDFAYPMWQINVSLISHKLQNTTMCDPFGFLVCKLKYHRVFNV